MEKEERLVGRMLGRKLGIQRQVEGLVSSKEISSPTEGKAWRMATPVCGSWREGTAGFPLMLSIFWLGIAIMGET